jgi:hypothetical protein
MLRVSKASISRLLAFIALLASWSCAPALATADEELKRGLDLYEHGAYVSAEGVLSGALTKAKGSDADLIRLQLARTKMALGKLDGTEALLTKAFADLGKTDVEHAVSCLDELANLCSQSAKRCKGDKTRALYDRARAYLLQALELQEKTLTAQILRKQPGLTTAARIKSVEGDRIVCEQLRLLGLLECEQIDGESSCHAGVAKALITRANSIDQSIEHDSLDVACDLSALAAVDLKIGDWQNAEDNLHRAIAICRLQAPNKPGKSLNLGRELSQLATVLSYIANLPQDKAKSVGVSPELVKSRQDELAKTAAEALSKKENALGLWHPELISDLELLAGEATRRKDMNAAQKSRRRVAEIRQKSFGRKL